MKERHKAVPAVYLILQKDNKIFLMRRFNTGYQDGNYMVPGGHVEANEPPSMTIIREAEEELGISIKKEDMRLAHTMYRAAHDATGERVDLFFVVERWEKDIVNKEPAKCDDAGWWPLTALPENIVPYIQKALNHIQRGEIYSELDWV